MITEQVSMTTAFAPFHSYAARWRYADPDLGRVSMPVEVIGRPNRDGDVLCSVSDSSRLAVRGRATDVLLPLSEIAALDQDCYASRATEKVA